MVGLHAQRLNDVIGLHGWKRALARSVERSHPDCRKPVRRLPNHTHAHLHRCRIFVPAQMNTTFSTANLKPLNDQNRAPHITQLGPRRWRETGALGMYGGLNRMPGLDFATIDVSVALRTSSGSRRRSSPFSYSDRTPLTSRFTDCSGKLWPAVPRG